MQYRLLAWKPGPGICDFTLTIQRTPWQSPKCLRWLFGERSPSAFQVYGSCTVWMYLPSFHTVNPYGRLQDFLMREYDRIKHTIASAEERRS